ncbi:MAG: CapA family protein [Deltaproteobacteria bacterium]|jgi:poly-gamma-glutamate capsule biosynthesis protein CapA/YwtB (metallophosphatase superfamily)|nr:CapA family protein [Deltaproteobacteria bacterium]MBT6502153.1 CapA family protein [Deltaproteobacteria bacterium]MBT6614977.1 CapA family protein [Deltaproteobacteria bacterium]MBT7711619.1 CapA family protein [Deltaproteobacteria bacterium]
MIIKQKQNELDWNSGKWVSSVKEDLTAEIMITGDWAPIRTFAPLIAQNPEEIYGDLLPVLRQSDLRITNLECPLTNGENQVWKSGSMLKGLPTHISGLTAVPFEVVTTANNHVLDYGRDGFSETHRLLSDNGIQAVGSGQSGLEAEKPLILGVKGIQIGIVNFSEGEDQTAAADGAGVFGWEVEKVQDIVQELRSKVDVVIVISHCGVEYIPFPPPYVEQAFQGIADAGADLVIGHHPHVPQGLQIYNGVPICYSLGNFVFYQETELIYRKTGYMVRVGISPKGVVGIELIPYEIQADRLSLLQGAKRDWFFESLQQVSLPLSKPNGAEDAWNGFLSRYGKQGFKDEIQMLMERLDSETEKGAAMFRNRLTTMQHQQHWIDTMNRMISGTIDQAPEWSLSLLEQWLTQKR